MTPLAAYLLLFTAVGAGFILVHLVLGKLVRPDRPDAEKETIYECGEPTIGSAWVQFDLRYYVVALLFVIFDVEVAFFFPWAEVFGKANAIANVQAAPRLLAEDATGKPQVPEPPLTAAEFNEVGEKILDLATPTDTLVAKAALARWEKMRTLKQADLTSMTPNQRAALTLSARDGVRDAQSLAWLALVEVLVFFGVLLVGFAYLWRRGDIEWVRGLAAPQMEPEPVPPAVPAPPAVREMATATPEQHH